MLIKQGSIDKEAFWGLVGRAIGGIAGLGAKGVGKVIGKAVDNPGKAFTLAGAVVGAYDTAGQAIKNFNEIAATPYRYF